MRRRQLIAGATAIALQSSFFPSASLLRAAVGSLPDRVRPSDPAWPTAARWKALNAAVGGNLIKVAPLFEVCKTDPAGPACSELVKYSRNPFYIGDQAAGTQISGWVDAWRPAPSVYAVAARNAADVVAAVNFARENNLRLVVKGGGHSYQGTSNAPDSLLIWTRAMRGIVVHDDFVPRGCGARHQALPAVTIDAGAMWIDAYDACTTKAGRYVQGGGCTSVGVAGLVQSGGFGSFSKGFGTAAASLLEAQIVTADGVLRTVNSCSDPELYWAIKGGGGGSWGVVTQLTLQTHTLPPYLGSAEGTIQARSDTALVGLIERFLDFYANELFNPHWGEQLVINPDNTLRVSMTCQGLDAAQPAAIWEPFFSWVKADRELAIKADLSAGSGPAQHWWDPVYRKSRGSTSMISDPRPGVPEFHAWWNGDQDQVGAVLYGYESLWLPSRLLQKNERSRLARSLFAASRLQTVELHFNKGLAGAPAEAIAAAKNTATNPSVLDAFALANIADGGPPAFSGLPHSSIDVAGVRKKAKATAQAMSELRRLAPNAGAYVSESNYFDAMWQQSFWGANYPRLRAVKAKYDPRGLFYVHHGVGSDDWSADGFRRVRAR